MAFFASLARAISRLPLVSLTGNGGAVNLLDWQLRLVSPGPLRQHALTYLSPHHANQAAAVAGVLAAHGPVLNHLVLHNVEYILGGRAPCRVGCKLSP